MAGSQRITDLTALGAGAIDTANDLIPVVDVSDTTMAPSGTDKKISLTNLLSNAPTLGGHPTIEGVTSTGATGTGNIAFSAAPTFTGTTTMDTATITTLTDEVPNANIPNGINNGTASAVQSQITVAGTKYYITNSNLAMPATAKAGMKIGTRFVWRVAMMKTNAGTIGFDILIYRGTNGTSADTNDVDQSIGAQTAAVDNMIVDVQVTVVSTGATGSYFWCIAPTNKAITATGFGVATGTAAYPSGTVSSVAMNTASLQFGLGFKSNTGTPTITIPMVYGQAFNMD